MLNNFQRFFQFFNLIFYRNFLIQKKVPNAFARSNLLQSSNPKIFNFFDWKPVFFKHSTICKLAKSNSVKFLYLKNFFQEKAINHFYHKISKLLQEFLSFPKLLWLEIMRWLEEFRQKFQQTRRNLWKIITIFIKRHAVIINVHLFRRREQLQVLCWILWICRFWVTATKF